MKVIIYNKELNQDFWNENKQLRPEIKQTLLKISSEFIKEYKLDAVLKDILFLGSSANYNWTPTSDVDLHVLVDGGKMFTQSTMARMFFDAVGKKWNQSNEVKIKGHKVEIYIQDIKEINSSTGVYSILKDQWVKEATPQKVSLDKNLIQQKYSSWVNRINKSVRNPNEDVLKKVLEDLMMMRQSGLDKAGEFSTENIVFKILRQRNIIKKLKDSVQNIKNKTLSLKT